MRLQRAAAVVLAAAIMGPALAQEPTGAPATESECWRLTDELSAAALFSDLGEEEQHGVFVLLDRLQDACNSGELAEAGATIAELEMALGK